jgi:hypothetical protein
MVCRGLDADRKGLDAWERAGKPSASVTASMMQTTVLWTGMQKWQNSSVQGDTILVLKLCCAVLDGAKQL